MSEPRIAWTGRETLNFGHLDLEKEHPMDLCTANVRAVISTIIHKLAFEYRKGTDAMGSEQWMLLPEGFVPKTFCYEGAKCMLDRNDAVYEKLAKEDAAEREPGTEESEGDPATPPIGPGADVPF